MKLDAMLNACCIKAIKLLGGFSAEDMEHERKKHEEWAIEYLTGKNGETVPDCLFYIPFDGDDIIVLRSRIKISNARIAGLKVAPWCRNVESSGLYLK